MIQIHTIGHSTRSFLNFVELLRERSIFSLADIRTVPRSRFNPQFNQESLQIELPKTGIAYRHLPELGGFRKPRPDSVNNAWRDAGFRGFADYMVLKEFSVALESVIELARSAQLALMCAEGNPRECHRLLIADALVVRGVSVWHIVSREHAKEHVLTPFARVEEFTITYPGLMD
jgi:uncharacterized protein (DUF488 family)